MWAFAAHTRRHRCRVVPARTICGSTRPAPAETFLCEESFTKSTPKTSWFLDFRRRGSHLTPFEPPCSQESYYNDVTTCCPKWQVQNLTSSYCRGRQGRELCGAKFPRGVTFLQKSSENETCFILGTAHKKVRQRRKAEVRSCPSEENPKRMLPLWHAFDYFPRERKVIAGAGRVDPQYSCRKFGEGNKVSFSYPHHQKCNCAESPSAGLGCVSP